MDQPHPADDVAHLPALHVTDEVPREQVAVKPLLLEQGVASVLPHQRHAGLVQCRQLRRRHVLGGGQDLDAVAHALPDDRQVLGHHGRIKHGRRPLPAGR
jgi:hypothetical protein